MSIIRPILPLLLIIPLFLSCNDDSMADSTDSSDQNEPIISSSEMKEQVDKMIHYIEINTSERGAETPHYQGEIVLEQLVSPNFVRSVKPSTLKQEDMSFAEFQSALAAFKLLYFDTFDISIQQAFPSSNKYIITAKSDALVKDGTNYGQEYVVIFEFDQEGRIKNLTEYVDSFYTVAFFNLNEL